ncbi:thiolase family protein [Streptomyces sp. NPDC008343]|uniref:thiolase family protein n=1 Tax=Streptomyces sp. NPDC008343 TaxID=3364828 RepID=UPI0036E01C38
MSRDAVIVGAVRTPLGKRGGGLSGVHPVDLAAGVLRELVERTGVDPALVDDVVFGCVSQIGEQAVNVGRNALLAAGYPESVPGTTVDRQCGSSQQAAHFAAAGLVAGHYDLVVAGGVESMSRVPMLRTVTDGPGDPWSPGIFKRYPDFRFDQGIAAENIARKWNITREEADRLSLESHHRAIAARDRGAFDAEIVPAGAISSDEGPRPTTSAEALAGLPSAFIEDGQVTAGNSSQISDGAAALLMTTSDKARELGLTPLARVHSVAVKGADPIEMLTATIPATQAVLARSGLRLGDMDSIEINEAFATVVLAWAKELGRDGDLDMKKVNPRGGSIALGHPLGGSGARLMTTLVHSLLDTGGRYGLQVMCEGGGMANATVLERL